MLDPERSVRDGTRSAPGDPPKECRSFSMGHGGIAGETLAALKQPSPALEELAFSGRAGVN
jgi:hypothetical protein